MAPKCDSVIEKEAWPLEQFLEAFDKEFGRVTLQQIIPVGDVDHWDWNSPGIPCVKEKVFSHHLFFETSTPVLLSWHPQSMETAAFSGSIWLGKELVWEKEIFGSFSDLCHPPCCMEQIPAAGNSRSLLPLLPSVSLKVHIHHHNPKDVKFTLSGNKKMLPFPHQFSKLPQVLVVYLHMKFCSCCHHSFKITA